MTGERSVCENGLNPVVWAPVEEGTPAWVGEVNREGGR